MPAVRKTKPSPLRSRRPGTPRKKRSSLFPESQVQKGLLEWLSLYNYEVRKRVIKIDNEGTRNNLLATVLGLHAGASDLFIAWPTRLYAGLWLEIKRPNYRVTPSGREHYDRQCAFIRLMRDSGYWADMGIGIEECMDIVTKYLNGVSCIYLSLTE